MHANVKAWLDADYKITSNKPSKIKDSDLNYSGLVLWDITKGSIADALGIQSGDILIRINGKMPDQGLIEDSKEKARKFGKYKFEIFHPKTRTLKTITARHWIYGAKYCPTAQEFARNLRISDPDLRQCITFWQQGDEAGLAELFEAYEVLNYRMMLRDGEPYYKSDFTLPEFNAPLSDGIWHANYSFLALCAAKAGHFKRARYVLDEVYHRMEQSDGRYPSEELSILAYTESLICSHKAEHELAIDWMHNAIERSRNIEINYRRLSQLTGNTVSPPPSIFINSRIKYDLEKKHDMPAQSQKSGRASFTDAVQSLKADQYLIVTLLADYRSNYFYYEGCRTSAVILDKLRAKFPLVHTLSGGTHSIDNVFNSAETYLDKAKVTYTLLNDEDCKVADQMSIEKAPTHLIINAKGDIIAEGDLIDGYVLWGVLHAEQTKG